MTRTVGLFMGVEPDTYDLPHPEIGLPIILLVCRVLERAFERLKVLGEPLGDKTEDTITIAIHEIIENDLRARGSVRGFDKRTFDRVERHVQVKSFNGDRTRTTPDMVFHLRPDQARILSTQHGLFVECKPVDRRHPLLSAYCAEGLMRFVEGAYAWAMQEAMMVGYVRHERSISRDLAAVLEEHRERLSLCGALESIPRAPEIHRSIHTRPFTWRDGKGPATPITIFHAWYACEP